jgi:HYR domain/Secretion system C-terminal sorting domain/Domain of unknown function DUF11
MKSSFSSRIALIISVLVIWLKPITSHAQNWTLAGNLPEYPIAYDQNGLRRVAVTRHNVYTSANGGTMWTQRLTVNNAPFLAEPNFYQLDDDFCFVYDEVIFITVQFGIPFGGNNTSKVYVSGNDGATWKEVFKSSTVAGAGISIVNGYDQKMWQADATTFVTKFTLNGISPNFTSIAQFYVSTDNGQNWALAAQESDPGQDFEFSGITPTQYVYHQGNRVIYRNKTNSVTSTTVTLPAPCFAVAVSNNDIRAAAVNIPGNTVRAWRSTTGGAPFTALTQAIAGAPGIANVQIIDQNLFVATGDGPFFLQELYRFNFATFNAPVHLSADPNYANYYPFRLATDGALINAKFGEFPHTPNIFNYSDGLAFDRPFVSSNDQFTSYTKVAKPNYALNAMPLLQGRRVRFAGDVAWNTTDGVNYNKSFDLVNRPQRLRYFSGAAFVNAYSDPTSFDYLTNDALTSEPTPDAYIAEAGNALYSTRPNTTSANTRPVVFKSLNNGETWAKANDGYFWNVQGIVGDKATGILYGFADHVGSGTISYKLSRSTDEGVSWQFVTGSNIPTISLTATVDPVHPRIAVFNNYIFVKDVSVLYVSTNGGISFNAVATPFPLTNCEMYISNGLLTLETREEQLWQRDINLWLGAAGGTLAPAAQVDMSLTVEMIPANPAPFTNFQVKYTIRNTGSIPATNAGLGIDIGGDVVEQGGNPPTYVNWAPGFGVNTLAPNATASVTFNYFRQNGSQPNAWGSLGYFEPDADSQNNNTLYPNVFEDDEAFYQAGGASPCAPDVTPPTLSSCPNNINLNIVLATAVASWTPPTATDNCPGAVTITSTNTPGQSFPVGVTVVTYTARDAANNTRTCSFTITITQANTCLPDVTRPTLTACPANINLTTPLTSTVATWTPPTATDNCPGAVTITSTHNSFQTFPLGTTTVTYTARDAANNTTSCSFTVTVTNTSTTCTGNLLTNPGFEFANDLEGWLFGPNIRPGSTTPGSQYAGVRSLVVCGDGQFYQTQPATAGITYNLSAFVSANPGSAGGKLMYLRFLTSAFVPISTDFTEITLTTFTQISLTKLSPAGTAWVEIGFFKDAASTPCFYVDEVCLNTGTVNPCSPDVTRPVLTACPANINLTTAGTSAVATWTAPTATDNCPGSVTVIGSATSGTAFAVGATTVTYTARDVANNTATCSFTVTVTQNTNPCSPDVTRPVLTACPANINLTTVGTSAVATWTAPTATDNCPGSVTVTGSATSGQTFAEGVTTVIYTARDAANNTTACAFTVRVTSDNTTCEDNLIRNPGFEPYQDFWNQDSGTGSITSSEFPHSGSWAVKICTGPTRLYQTVTGAATATQYNLKAWVLGTGGGSGVMYLKFMNSQFTPLSTDFLPVQGAFYTQFNISKLSPVGTAFIEVGFIRNNTTGCIYVDDVCLTSGTITNPCSPDVTPPTMTCPASQSLQTAGTSIVATWTPPTPADNCTAAGAIVLSTTHSPGATFPLGTTTVTYTARDAASNSTTCSFNITVSQPGTGGADLRVTMTSDRVTVPQWGNFTVTVTARNEGTSPISSAMIIVGVCELNEPRALLFRESNKVVFAAGQPIPSAGTFNITQEWTLTNLAAGQSATLTIPLFTLGTSQKVVIAYANTQAPNDPDSQPSLTRPANCLPTQDDEAAITINAGQALQSSNNTTPTAVDDVAAWLLFPNPASQEVMVRVDAEVQAISIIGQLGNTVQRIMTDTHLPLATDQNGVIRLDLSQIPTGMYHVRLDLVGKRSVMKKLVVVNE